VDLIVLIEDMRRWIHSLQAFSMHSEPWWAPSWDHFTWLRPGHQLRQRLGVGASPLNSTQLNRRLRTQE